MSATVRGLVGTAVLSLVVAGHLLMQPDGTGCVFRWLLDVLPAALRPQAVELGFEAVAQAFLVVGPPLSLYSGWRGLGQGEASVSSCLAFAGGGILSVLTGLALLSVLVS